MTIVPNSEDNLVCVWGGRHRFLELISISVGAMVYLLDSVKTKTVIKSQEYCLIKL